MKRRVLGVSLVLVMLSGGFGYAASPVESLRHAIGQVLDILKGATGQNGADVVDRYARIRQVVHQAFDFRRISHYALGKHWQRLTPSQQAAFSEAFAELVSRVYLERIDGDFETVSVSYNECKYAGETRNWAKVMTRVRWKYLELDVDYSLHRCRDDWRICDVWVQQVSLVKNWRQQFHDLLRQSRPDELIPLIKKQIERYKQPDGAA